MQQQLTSEKTQSKTSKCMKTIKKAFYSIRSSTTQLQAQSKKKFHFLKVTNLFSIFHHSFHFSHSFSSIKQKVNHKKENHQNQNFVILNTENSTSPRRQNQRKNWTRHFLISQASQPILPIKKINTKQNGSQINKK